MSKVLCFSVLDETYHKLGPLFYSFNTEDELPAVLDKIWKERLRLDDDPSTYFFKQKDQKEYKSMVLTDLVEQGWFAWNRYQKYYSIVFSVDYRRMWVWAKDIDPEVVKWREEDEKDEIVKNFNPKHNQCPVSTLVGSLLGDVD